MRRHDRHDSNIPIRIHTESPLEDASTALINIGSGGLSCSLPLPVTIGNTVEIEITLTDPPATLAGTIRWCKKFHDHFDIGIEFSQQGDPFLLRMVRQICAIEEYRHEQFRQNERELSSEEAAVEWIEKYAADFGV